MIVPEYWAEAKGICAVNKRKINVKRFGWSDKSVDEAQRHANIRLADAIRLMESGTVIPKREPKTAYNGAEGVPIREEIISRHDDVLITRNGYGARCLNTPDVLFADIDLPIGPNFFLRASCILSLLCVAGIISWLTNSWDKFILMGFLSLFLGTLPAHLIHRSLIARDGKKNAYALNKIRRFSERHPQWHLRVYKTPMGFRILVMHDVFDPRSDEVKNFFQALAVDSMYQKMCFHQRCFRARVSAKPWRIGINEHLRPRPGVWPINAEKLPIRHAWVENYESRAQAYASCHFVITMGSSHVHEKALSVQKLHDELSRALTDLPIA